MRKKLQKGPIQILVISICEAKYRNGSERYFDKQIISKINNSEIWDPGSKIIK